MSPAHTLQKAQLHPGRGGGTHIRAGRWAAVKSRLLDMTWMLYSWTHSSCGFMCKTCTVSIQLKMPTWRVWCFQGLGPSQEAIHSSWLSGEEWLCLRSVAIDMFAHVHMEVGSLSGTRATLNGLSRSWEVGKWRRKWRVDIIKMHCMKFKE